jgi:hypothetical protein
VRVAALAVVVALLWGFVATLAPSSPSSLPGDRNALPATPRAGFSVPDPEPLGDERSFRWATVDRRVTARSRPGGASVATLGTRTPEKTQNLVLVLGRARRHAGELWVRVRMPVLPNNTTGWVPRRALGGYHTVDTRLVVDREKLQAVLYEGDERVFRARVGIGESQSPTPPGRFYVRVKLTSYRSDFYGPLAYGLSARSDVLTDWPAGGFVGIHGTDRPELIPGRISHGCIRMSNEDILELGELMPVGTPVTVI